MRVHAILGVMCTAMWAITRAQTSSSYLCLYVRVAEVSRCSMHPQARGCSQIVYDRVRLPSRWGARAGGRPRGARVGVAWPLRGPQDGEGPLRDH